MAARVSSRTPSSTTFESTEAFDPAEGSTVTDEPVFEVGVHEDADTGSISADSPAHRATLVASLGRSWSEPMEEQS